MYIHNHIIVSLDIIVLIVVVIGNCYVLIIFFESDHCFQIWVREVTTFFQAKQNFCHFWIDKSKSFRFITRSLKKSCNIKSFLNVAFEWCGYELVLKQLENNRVIVKNERGGSLFYALTKNQIVRIISIASYLTKKKFETKKIICCSRRKCSLGHIGIDIFFSTQIKFKFTRDLLKK